MTAALTLYQPEARLTADGIKGVETRGNPPSGPWPQFEGVPRLPGRDPCPVCEGEGRCDPIPARGRQGLWEWEAA